MRHALVLLTFCIFYVLCQTPLSHLFSQGSTQAIHYSIFLCAHGQTHAQEFHCPTARTHRYFSDISRPASNFISTHLPKNPSHVWNYHAFIPVKLYCEKQAPLPSTVMKKKHEKTPSAIYTAPSLFAKNLMFSFPARSKVYVKTTARFEVS